MPICPGCEQSVPYDRLDIHQRYCDGLRSGGVKGRAIERLEHRVATLERRLEARVRDVETDFERRLTRLEQKRRARQTSRKE